MIDWLKFRAPWFPPEKIGGDRVLVIDPNGELKWEKLRPLEMRGSHDCRLFVSSCPVDGRLLIDGNPVKFFQAHNLWGTDDLHGLGGETLRAVNELGQLGVPGEVLDAVFCGNFELSRIDLTQMYATGSRARCMAALRQMGDSSSISHGGRGTIGEHGTVYYRKHSRRKAMKAYCKGRELEAADHRLPKEIMHRAPLLDFADDKLRIEVVLRAMGLKELGLERASAWCITTGANIFQEMVAELKIPEMSELDVVSLESLPPRMRLVHVSWKAGEDLRATLPRKTFYRYRLELLKHGIDIGLVQPRAEASNVVRLRTIIDCIPVQVPDWARGTSLYFEPRRTA